MKENPDIQPKQQIPLKICYTSHHSDVTDAMKKEIDSYKDLPWPKIIFAEELWSGCTCLKQTQSKGMK